MGSYLMHIGITEKVRKKLNLSYKFIYGSILPDLIKMGTGDRKGSHFLKTIIDGENVKNLPVIENAISMLRNKLDKEVYLGYIAHLIEDHIWFEKYIPTFATVYVQGKLSYLSDNSEHSSFEFSKDIYEDYEKINAYMVEVCNVDYSTLKQELEKIMNETELNFLNKNANMRDVKEIHTTKIITKDRLDEYIKESEEKVEEVIKNLLGE